MKKNVFYVLLALVIAAGMLILFSRYLSRSGSQKDEIVLDSNERRSDFADVKTPEISDKLTLPTTITDSKGHQLTLESPPKRIIVTSSEAANCIIFLGKADYVIGRLSHQKQPELAHAKIVSGGSLSVNYEAISAMKPDMVLLNLMNYEQKVRLCDKYKIPHFAFKIKRIDEMTNMYRLFTKLLDAEPSKVKEIESLINKLKRVDERMKGLKDEERPKVFFEAGYRPGLRTMVSDSITADIIWRAGGKMYLAGKSFTAPVSIEVLMNEPPDWYLIAQGFLGGDTTLEQVKKRPMLGKLSCIEDGQVFLVDSLSYIQSHPKTIDNIIELSRKLHPDRMKDF